MSTSNLKMIVETMKMIECGPIDATTEKYLKKMAKYAAKIQETRNLLQHKLERDFQSKEEKEEESKDEESKSNDEESKSNDDSDEEIIYGDSDDDTAICAITASNVIEGKRVRRTVQKYQDPDYDKIILRDIPQNEIEAAIIASDVDEDEDEDEDEEVENSLGRNRGQFLAENGENEENEQGVGNLRLPDPDSEFELDDEDDYDEDSDVIWMGDY